MNAAVPQIENRVAVSNSVRRKGGAAKYSPEKPKVSLRTFFPENWLFQLESIGEETVIRKELKSPHTLTTWQAEAICIHDGVGLGVAKPASLLVNQDFFAELRLPYSVKRGEKFPLNVTVFNYIDVELPITVKLITAEEEVMAEKTEYELCIGAKDNKVISMGTVAKKLGDLKVKVEAKITNGIKNCKDVEAGNGFTDALEKPLKVKPEGVPVEKVESDFKCFESGTEKFSMSKLEIPDNAVEDSERAWVYVTGDIMAPALENVGNLVRLPTGCGEQNMVGLVPNIYLLQYLDSTNQKKPELQKKAKEYMRIGYDRQQKYRHPNGAYSIWGGDGDKDGSTWLTSFVVKSFSEASQYVKIDRRLVQSSVDWLLKGQMENGCFRKRGYVHSSYLKGGASDDSLTPFVVAALLEAKTSKLGIEVEDRKMREAVECMLRSVNTTDLYSSIVTAYSANLLSNKLQKKSELPFESNLELSETMQGKLEEVMEAVLSRANTSEVGAQFWDNERKKSRWGYYYPSSEAVEMTAYMVMNFVLRDEVPKALESVKWLARQRNSQGGFVSTQDTVVALQALSKYSQEIGKTRLDMSVDVTEKNEGEAENKLNTFTLNEDNSLLLQTQKLTKLPSQLELDTSGSGCAMVQTVLRYNMPEVQENSGFLLTATGDTNSIEDPSLNICTEYTGDQEQTGMVLLEVEMVTGWEAVNPHNLKNEVASGVERVEVDDEGKVVLYFDSIPKKQHCISLELKHVSTIEDAKEALITVYDYYNREDTASFLYNLE